MYKRSLNISQLIEKNSLFLFGPRGAGKSTLINTTLKPALMYDLLDPITFTRLATQPTLLKEETAPLNSGQQVVIDEIQKLPQLLDSVHSLIESKKLHFLLTGSSARKLKRDSSTNLLGGRAWEAHLFPLTSSEISGFDLIRYLNFGGLPKIYLSKNPLEDLRAYIGIYLKEEILAEALVRKLDHFSRFLEIAAQQSGEELVFETIASDAAIKAKTVGNYIEILEDTLLGFKLNPFWKSKKRKAITRSKFYLFDVGVTNFLAKRGQITKGSELFGKAFEQFIVCETKAYLSYSRGDHELCYWRTANGDTEVDMVIDEHLAVEIKGSPQVNERHLKGLRTLGEEKTIKKSIIVSLDPKERHTEDGIIVLPWKDYLDQLWSGDLI